MALVFQTFETSRKKPNRVLAGDGYEMYAYMIIKEYSFYVIRPR